MLVDLLFALGIRFFLFDFILLKNIRDKLNKKYYIFRKLFSCTFCQGFWCGLFIALLQNCHQPWNSFKFAFIAAIVSFTWTVIMDPYIGLYEEQSDLPMTRRTVPD
ncbi:hypothetical protein [Phosphitispora sp. TUW77]|uniref:hypothetical protein n=1 Tax=Phosphitispora sp. TUW77 TaxID=3152361 RepID=UPI003AB7A674